MEKKTINGIPFKFSDMVIWRKQYNKEQFYDRAKAIYWLEFDSDIQLRCIDEMWAMGEVKSEPPKEDKKPSGKK